MPHNNFSEPFIALLDVVARLRSPQGCPWDAQQTPQSLKPYLREECYEVLEAIDQASPQAIMQELGDLLLQIVLIARMFEETKQFDIGDVAKSITEKLIRRHPHVFAGTRVESLEALNIQWDNIKAREQGLDSGQPGLLNNVPKDLPALAKAQKVTSKASRVGFDWPDPRGVFEKINEELQEFRKAWENSNKTEMEDEFGDILLSLVNLARFLDIEAEDTLQKSVNRFQSRFEYLEKQLKHQGINIREATLEDMDRLWEAAKRKEQALTRCGTEKSR
ncbi:MAG: nucleoside triphosphate pyrophosphohydrolase [Deltaproteobacteria bacterium]|nr:nucleoside triphosphate pyrophosphohydrolase [Deltaproteobacteria bacterium]